MKAALLFFSLLATSSAALAATSGQYVCQTADVDWSNGTAHSSTIQKALNSLGCDNAKPFTTTPIASTDGVVLNLVVCCVKK